EGRRPPNIINSLYLQPQDLEDHNIRLARKHALIEAQEVRYESYRTDDAHLVFVSYGTSSRIVRNAVEVLRSEGIKVGMIRPITLWPWPQVAFDELGDSVRALMAVEMSMGQMIDDVKIAAAGRWPVGFYGRSGGMIPDQHAIGDAARRMLKEVM
ncbi:MAG: 3-methyl-2-oxobutanoate dehydrogenase subunit beta, partial [Alkalispirochaeta sp.]